MGLRVWSGASTFGGKAGPGPPPRTRYCSVTLHIQLLAISPSRVFGYEHLVLFVQIHIKIATDLAINSNNHNITLTFTLNLPFRYTCEFFLQQLSVGIPFCSVFYMVHNSFEINHNLGINPSLIHRPDKAVLV